MAMTLADLAAMSKDPMVPGIISAILASEAGGGGNLLRFLDFEEVNSFNPVITKYNTEGSTGVGWRSVGQTFSEGTTTTYQEQWSLGEIGGEIIIDKAVIKGSKNALVDPVAFQIKRKVDAINRVVNNTVINGDVSSTPGSINGLRKLVDNQQVVKCTDVDGTATNGIAIGPSATTTTQKQLLRALDMLVEAIGGYGQKNAILLMNSDTRLALQWACREGNYFNQNMDHYDRPVDTYKGIRIANPGAKNPTETWKDAKSTTNAVLASNRPFGNNSDCAEIYAIRTGASDDGLYMAQFGPIETSVVAEEMQAAPARQIRISWDVGLIRPRKDNIAVLTGFRPVA